jgi:alpha-beta hydrolase superfamily lysophospholipase
MKKLKLKSSNGIDTLNVVLWDVESPKGIVQIAHGMIEYVERYDRFAKFLNSKGFVVVGNDHLGHGYTASSIDDLGYMNGPYADVSIVRDMHRVSVAVKRRYPNLPLFLVGHSMGSFLSRRYAMSYGDEIDGLILMGTGEESKASINMGKFTVMLNSLIFGERHRSTVIALMLIGRYNLKFLNEKSYRSWISANVENRTRSGVDRYCTYKFTNKGYRALLDTLGYITNQNHVRLIPNDLPVLFVSGSDDPVGAFKKGVNEASNKMIDAGVNDVEIIFYDGMRHEILNEDGYELVHNDIYEWIGNHM